MIDHDAALLALRARAEAYLPTGRESTNLDFTPTTGVAYCEEDYVPATHVLRSVPASNGVAQETGLYVIRWYGLANTGPHVIGAAVNALLARFTPGTDITAGSNTLHIGGATRGQLLPAGDGFTVCTITIPWYALSTNVIAA